MDPNDLPVCIYQMECVPNHKKYVGMTYNLATRRLNHRSAMLRGKANKRVLADYRKYGLDAFTFKALEYVPESSGRAAEILWIRKLNARNPRAGYNIQE